MRRESGKKWAAWGGIFLCLLIGLAGRAQAQASQEVEASLTYLLDLAADRTATFELEKIAPLLDFAQRLPFSGPDGDVPLKERKTGEGVAIKASYSCTLAKYLEYYFNPQIPSAIVYPNSVRLLKWYPDSAIATHRPYLWETRDLAAPLVLRGREYEEITPDENSGSFYSYPLARLVILACHDGKLFFLTVSKQEKRSNVGLKGAIVGQDDDWNYVYTKESGATRGGIGWMDTYIYDSATIGIFYADSMTTPGLTNVAFKWLKAGWKSINVVKQSHILNGLRRYEAGLKSVLESPAMPSPAALAAEYARARAMSDEQLRAALGAYARGLEAAIPANEVLGRDEFRKILENGAYPASLGRDYLLNQYMLNVIRAAVGRFDPATGKAPHADGNS